MTFHECCLTAKDFTYLQSLLASKDFGAPYLTLLREKLGAATLLLDHTIDHRIATIESRVEFSVDGAFMEQRILARDEANATPGLALPVTTLRGLALVGLREGGVFTLRKPGGVVEVLRLMRVAYQPEAARRTSAGTVVPFQPRWMKSLSAENDGTPGPFGDDPDPGPGAA